MAPVTTRRRPDGIVEIVPPTALQRFLFDFRSAFLAMGALAAVVVVGVLYAIVGVPVLVATAFASAAVALWRRIARKHRPVQVGAARPRRRSAL